METLHQEVWKASSLLMRADWGTESQSPAMNQLILQVDSLLHDWLHALNRMLSNKLILARFT